MCVGGFVVVFFGFNSTCSLGSRLIIFYYDISNIRILFIKIFY